LGFIIAALNALATSKPILCHYSKFMFINVKNIFAQKWTQPLHLTGA